MKAVTIVNMLFSRTITRRQIRSFVFYKSIAKSEKNLEKWLDKKEKEC